jgi:hypothetical protein
MTVSSSGISFGESLDRVFAEALRVLDTRLRSGETVYLARPASRGKSPSTGLLAVTSSRILFIPRRRHNRSSEIAYESIHHVEATRRRENYLLFRISLRSGASHEFRLGRRVTDAERVVALIQANALSSRGPKHAMQAAEASRDLRTLAERYIGLGRAFAYTRPLRRLERLIDADEHVHRVCVAVRRAWRMGPVVITDRQCAYAMRRYLFSYEITSFVYGSHLEMRARTRKREIDVTFESREIGVRTVSFFGHDREESVAVLFRVAGAAGSAVPEAR